MPDKSCFFALLGLLAASLIAALPREAVAQNSFLLEAPDRGRPAAFPRFSIPGHEEQADLLSAFLWYHFAERPGPGKVLFNKEYLALSDLWLAGAPVSPPSANLQAAYRSILLGLGISPEGYVYTHQHFSHAHDLGWPFPVWPQAGRTGEAVRGVTAGWHFQEIDSVKGWTGDIMQAKGLDTFAGQAATEGWELHHLRSQGFAEGAWQLTATGPSPALTTPEGTIINAFNAPYLQLRWSRSGEAGLYGTPYVEWMRDGDAAFSEERRVYFYPQDTPLSEEGVYHSIIEMHVHPGWEGTIKRIRIALAPGEHDVDVSIGSFFTVYDTRHTINNPIFILASDYYFGWTRDLSFLRENINRMRRALRYQQTVMGGLKHNRIRNTWPGHGGRPGFTWQDDSTKVIHPGRGLGSNYWDLLPFGWDDMYATAQYYAATQVMADLEEAIRVHPGWGIPGGPLAFDPDVLRRHAAEVKATANELFWNEETGRFVASIDEEGNAHDYGFTFLNLEAIWYGIASEEHAEAIMDWITGERTIAGDTSTGEDIYHWRFGPRATTRRNIEWYGWVWNQPEEIPWGGQVQDGGAVLGFTFYDLWARLHLRGPDNAWQRLSEITGWLADVDEAGGYRAYYEGGKRGTKLQGCGTPGGLGVDCEFYESSLVPSIVTYGFLGLDPHPDALGVAPELPTQASDMGIRNALYRGVRFDVQATPQSIVLKLKETPATAFRIRLAEGWRLVEETAEGADGAVEGRGPTFALKAPGTYRFEK